MRKLKKNKIGRMLKYIEHNICSKRKTILAQSADVIIYLLTEMYQPIAVLRS